MQAVQPSITSSLDQPGPSNASVNSAQTSMQPGKKFKREWMLSHNASVLSAQDREEVNLHALPGTSDVQVQSEFVSVYILPLTYT